MPTNIIKLDTSRGRETAYSPILDSFRRYLTDTPTPARMASLLKDIDNGDVAAMVELNEEMEAKDAHLQAVASRRRQAVTALEWSIERSPRAEDEDAAADDAAAYVADVLDGIEAWPDTLKHLATAIGPGIAATELVWDKGIIVDTVDVPGHRLTSQPWMDQSIRLQVDNDWQGMPMLRGKFIVYTPQSRAGYPMRCTITRAQLLLWVIKHHARANWAGFCEVFGMPVRVGKYGEGATSEEKTALRSMLENMGSDRWGMFSDSVSIEMIEAGRGTHPYSDFIDWLETKQTILYLGQTLTTDVGSVGSFAAAKVHENVAASILLDDLANEGQVIRNQVIRPLVAMKWPGRDVPMPVFVRKLIETKNIDADRLALEQVRAAKELGLRMDDAEVYERLGLTMPEDQPDEPDAGAKDAATVNELTLGVERAIRAGDLELVNALRTKIAALLGVELKPLAELPGPATPGRTPEPEPEPEPESPVPAVPAGA